MSFNNCAKRVVDTAHESSNLLVSSDPLLRSNCAKKLEFYVGRDRKVHVPSASLLVVSLEKTLSGILPSWRGRQMAGNS